MALETQNNFDNINENSKNLSINNTLGNADKIASNPEKAAAFTDSVKEWIKELWKNAKETRDSKESKEGKETPPYCLSVADIMKSIPNYLSTENIPDEYKSIVESLLDWKITPEETKAFQSITAINKYYPWEKWPSGDWDFWPKTGYALVKMLWWDSDWYRLEMKAKLDAKRTSYNNGKPESEKVALFEWPEEELK